MAESNQEGRNQKLVIDYLEALLSDSDNEDSIISVESEILNTAPAIEKEVTEFDADQSVEVSENVDVAAADIPSEITPIDEASDSEFLAAKDDLVEEDQIVDVQEEWAEIEAEQADEFLADSLSGEPDEDLELIANEQQITELESNSVNDSDQFEKIEQGAESEAAEEELVEAEVDHAQLEAVAQDEQLEQTEEVIYVPNFGETETPELALMEADLAIENEDNQSDAPEIEPAFEEQETEGSALEAQEAEAQLLESQELENQEAEKENEQKAEEQEIEEQEIEEQEVEGLAGSETDANEPESDIDQLQDASQENSEQAEVADNTDSMGTEQNDDIQASSESDSIDPEAVQNAAMIEQEAEAQMQSVESLSSEVEAEKPVELSINCIIVLMYGLKLAIPFEQFEGHIKLSNVTLSLDNDRDWILGDFTSATMRTHVVDTAQILFGDNYDALNSNYNEMLVLEGKHWSIVFDKVIKTQNILLSDVTENPSPQFRPWLTGTYMPEKCALVNVSAMVKMFEDELNGGLS